MAEKPAVEDDKNISPKPRQNKSKAVTQSLKEEI